MLYYKRNTILRACAGQVKIDESMGKEKKINVFFTKREIKYYSNTLVRVSSFAQRHTDRKSYREIINIQNGEKTKTEK